VEERGEGRHGDGLRRVAHRLAEVGLDAAGLAHGFDYRGRAVIVEERTYHVITGKLPEVVKLYADEGIELQQEYLGNLLGWFTVDVGELSSVVSLWGYESYGERERRRAELQADERWKAFLARLQPLLHTQWNRIMVPTSFSPIR